MPSLPAHHQLLELAYTHVHQDVDAIDVDAITSMFFLPSLHLYQMIKTN